MVWEVISIKCVIVSQCTCIYCAFWALCKCLSLFCYELLCVLSSFAIKLKRKKELVVLLLLSSGYLVTVNVL